MTPEENLNRIKQRVGASLAELAKGEPEFTLDIGFAQSYEDLFRGEGEYAEESAILDRTLTKGRAILVGRGGGGKTFLLRRVARQAFNQGILPFIVDLKRWEVSDSGVWNECIRNLGDGTPFLLNRFSEQLTNSTDLDWIPPSTKKLILVDGLNEISTEVGQQILNSLDNFVRNQIQASVVVTDRMTRRVLESPRRWMLCFVKPLTREKIITYGGGSKLDEPGGALLDSPFFLDSALRNHTLFGQKAKTSLHFLKTHASLSDPELGALSNAAFQAYRKYGSRTFSANWFFSVLGGQIVDKLLSAHILLTSGGEWVHFSHHLLQDALASKHVASLPNADWTPDTLDYISFHGSSFDVVALVLEQLEGDLVDAFLRKVYDWNLYAAGYALSELGVERIGPSAEMTEVILAMLAEKQFDAVSATRRRANDGLLLIGSDRARDYADASSLSDILASVRKLPFETDWFSRWRSIYCRASGDPAEDADILSLSIEDSIDGWTMANVVRRLQVSNKQAEILRIQLDSKDADATVRWRIVHVLGALPSPENMSKLLGVLTKDPSANVRYGAARSIAEIARLGHPELSKVMLHSISQIAADLVSDEKVLAELARALVVVSTEAPDGWSEVLMKFARIFYAESDDLASCERWKRYVVDIDREYRVD